MSFSDSRSRGAGARPLVGALLVVLFLAVPGFVMAASPGEGFVEVCKAAGGPGVAGTFEFELAGRTVSAPVGACSAPIQVAAGTVTVTELAQPGMIVTGIATQPAARLIGRDLAGRSATIAVAEGNVSSQTAVTFTNEFEIGRLKLCKVAGTGIVVGTNFIFNVDGLAVNVPAGPGPGGYCAFAGNFPAGSVVTITESTRTGVVASAIEVTPADRADGSPNLAGATVDVTIGAGTTEVTFTNRVAPPPTTTTTPTTTVPGQATTTTTPGLSSTTTVPGQVTTTTAPGQTTTTTIPGSSPTTTVPGAGGTTTTTTPIAGSRVAPPRFFGPPASGPRPSGPGDPGASTARPRAKGPLPVTGAEATRFLVTLGAVAMLGGLVLTTGARPNRGPTGTTRTARPVVAPMFPAPAAALARLAPAAVEPVGGRMISPRAPARPALAEVRPVDPPSAPEPVRLAPAAVGPVDDFELVLADPPAPPPASTPVLAAPASGSELRRGADAPPSRRLEGDGSPPQPEGARVPAPRPRRRCHSPADIGAIPAADAERRWLKALLRPPRDTGHRGLP